MDLIVEKATELGVGAILPVTTERVVATPGRRRAAKQQDRWQRIAVSAAKQCGLNWIPEVASVSDYAEALDRCRGSDLFLVGAITGETRPLHDVMTEARARTVGSASLVIGPEGDLTPAELHAAVAAGAVPVSFGGLVLRVETAALYGLAVLAYELA
jgi:16S rRNA (uracil1498-N3)-methyltransferase